MSKALVENSNHPLTELLSVNSTLDTFAKTKSAKMKKIKKMSKTMQWFLIWAYEIDNFFT